VTKTPKNISFYLLKMPLMSIRDGPRLDLENSRLHFKLGMTWSAEEYIKEPPEIEAKVKKNNSPFYM
jgi:hypothetical protein